MKNISAIILAAGKSTRMGRQKLLMPWGSTTVLGQVIRTLQQADIQEIVIVASPEIADSLGEFALRIVINPAGDMLTSLQLGLQALEPSAGAALVCLGDQPQVEERSVRSVCDAFQKSRSSLVVPSYHMRRGHPWLVARVLWSEVLSMPVESTMRDFLGRQASRIEYVDVDTPTILQDLDTPEDYLKYKPPM